MAVNLTLTLTLNGRDALWNSRSTGVELDITHLQFGARNRLTTGEESFLNQPKQYTQIQNGSKIGPDQVRIMATMPGVENYNVAEIGLWSGVPNQVGSILIAYKSVQTGFIAQMVSGIDLVFTYDMVLSTADIDNITIIKDTDQGSTFSLLTVHETDRNAHPYYLTTDTEQTVSGTKTFTSKAIFSSGLSGELDGNAATATKLETARTINGVNFDGTKDIDIGDPIGLFLGGVQWFNGARAKVPDGYLTADGQLLSRATYPDLWAAISITYDPIDDAVWLASSTRRACFSKGDGTTTFRMPDLNGIQPDSVKGLFLRGDGYDKNIGSVLSSQNLSHTHLQAYGALYQEKARYGTVADQVTSYSESTNGNSSTSGAYVEPVGGNEARPVSAIGVWIIRAIGKTTPQPANGSPATLLANTFNGSQEISGNLSVSGKIALGSSNLQVVTGSNYTVTYDYATRIAVIEMKVMSALGVGNSASPFKVLEGRWTANFTLPITLIKRLSAYFSFEQVGLSGYKLWDAEAGEWLTWCAPVGQRGSTESAVTVDIVRFRGGEGESIDGFLTVMGFF